MQKLTLIYVDSGGGHRAAATALREVIRRQQRPWEVEMVSIQDIFRTVDFIRKYTGIDFQDVYNIMLRRGWTLGSAYMIRLMHLVIRMSHASQVGALCEFWQRSRPDLVVSLIPHFNRAIGEALEHVWPGVPLVTLLTDIADHPPHFWIEKESQYVICGSDRAVNQAQALGLQPSRIFRTSGMVLNPSFYEPAVTDRDAARECLGLRPNVPTGLVLFGGEGSDQIVEIAKALNYPGSDVQLILLCGKNNAVAEKLRAMAPHIPMFVHGFTREVPFYMELADFFIGKPGPGSITEALAKRLPVIVQRNIRTLAHERYNADWVEEQGLGLVVSSFARDIRSAVATLVSTENYACFRQRVATMRNMAVYEIPPILEKLLGEPADRGNARTSELTTH